LPQASSTSTRCSRSGCRISFFRICGLEPGSSTSGSAARTATRPSRSSRAIQLRSSNEVSRKRDRMPIHSLLERAGSHVPTIRRVDGIGIGQSTHLCTSSKSSGRPRAHPLCPPPSQLPPQLIGLGSDVVHLPAEKTGDLFQAASPLKPLVQIEEIHGGPLLVAARVSHRSTACTGRLTT